MHKQIESIIAREEAFLPRFAPGTSQHSLLKNRIAALYTVRDELNFALPRIESIIHKMKKARDKYEPGSRNYLRFDPAVQLMENARALILQDMEDTQ